MQFTNAALSASLLSFAFALPSDVFPRQAGATCATGVHIIATPGEGSADPPYGLLMTTVSNITDAIAGSDGVAVPYDHTQTDGVTQSYDAVSSWPS